MRNPIAIRFAAAALLVLLACASLLACSVSLAVVCFGVNIFLVPRDYPDLSDSAMRRWLLGFAIRLVIILVLVGIAYFHPLPIAGTMQRIMFHPAFVVPFGLLGLWSLFRGWCKQKGMVGA